MIITQFKIILNYCWYYFLFWYYMLVYVNLVLIMKLSKLPIFQVISDEMNLQTKSTTKKR